MRSFSFSFLFFLKKVDHEEFYIFRSRNWEFVHIRFVYENTIFYVFSVLLCIFLSIINAWMSAVYRRGNYWDTEVGSPWDYWSVITVKVGFIFGFNRNSWISAFILWKYLKTRFLYYLQNDDVTMKYSVIVENWNWD